MFGLLRISFTMLLLFGILLGGIYPAVVTGVSQLLFHAKANGSVIERDGAAVGSRLLGQSFTQEKYFWGRPSATTPPYNPAASSGSNYGPMHPQLAARVKEDIVRLRKSDAKLAVPSDLVTASASGLDPHISLAAAQAQLPRVARARRMKEEELRALIDAAVEGPSLKIFGQKTVNVLKLNLMLDEKHGR